MSKKYIPILFFSYLLKTGEKGNNCKLWYVDFHTKVILG